MSLPTVIVTGTFRNADGTAKAGRVVFRLPQPMVDVDDNTIVPPSAVSVLLDSNGSISHALVPSDSPGMSPSPVAYHVTEAMPGGRSYFVVIPSANPTVLLSELVPLDVPPPATDTRAGANITSRAAALGLTLGASL